jgi:nucleoside-diphosphate-sugar epimerase
MVIGDGLLATTFKYYNNDCVIFLTSGISDSKSSDKNDMDRELLMIKNEIENNPNRLFIYFSTISIYTKNTDYTNHKLNVEKFIMNSSVKYIIFRLPQMVGIGGNKNNIFNFLKNKKIVDFVVIDTFRSFLDVDDLYNIVTLIISENNIDNIYNISGIEYLNMKEIINLFEISGDYEMVNSDEYLYFKNSPKIEEVIKRLGIDSVGYTKKLIEKYK